MVNIWMTLYLLLGAISQNMDQAVNLADQYNIKVFSKNMGYLEPIKIVNIKKCPKLQRIQSSKDFT